MRGLVLYVAMGAVLAPIFALGAEPGVDPRFELDPAAINRVQGGASPKISVPATPPAGKSATYKVRPGDTLRLILQREFGMGEAQVDAMLPRVKAANRITDVRHLRVGSTLQIPTAGDKARTPKRTAAKGRPERHADSRQGALPLRLVQHAGTPVDPVTPLQAAWPLLVPQASPPAAGGLTIDGGSYTMVLDPVRYPVLQGADGGTVLLDTAGTLPPLVRSLLASRSPAIRVVAEDPADRHRFVGGVLRAAGFYSVEEQFRLAVGSDPKLDFVADFKVERSPDSVLQQEVSLVDLADNGQPLPPPLIDFLNGEGFQVLEPYATAGPRPVAGGQGTLYRLPEGDPVAQTDALLGAMGLAVSRDRMVELFTREQDGLQLAIRVDRLFDERGDRYAVTFFDGDPVRYTLCKLLETRGYKVIVIDPKDDFARVSSRILGRLGGGGSHGVQTLPVSPGAPYAVRLTGTSLSPRRAMGGQVILTTRPLTPLVRELARYSGFTVVE